MGDTFQLLVSLFVNIETDHMCDKVYSLFFKFFCRTAGIRITSFFPV